jgi:radical SAM superfamily enzyme YgiQ (UPF0313 family)
MNVLLVNPPSSDSYRHTPLGWIIGKRHPPLGLLSIAANMPDRVTIWDMAFQEDPPSHIGGLQPHVIGITSRTANIDEAERVAQRCKQMWPYAKIVLGGAHVSATRIKPDWADAICIGEGDYYFSDKRAVEDLDALPYPAYHLVRAGDYRLSPLISRHSPVAYMETSRGCYGKCTYCTKSVFGSKMKFKSPQRVVDEMQYLADLGYREIHIYDDNFSADIVRVEQICELILQCGIKMAWLPRGGLRVDRVSLSMLKLMKRAGCYRVPLGVESGSEWVLAKMGKRIEKDQAREAVRWTRAAGMETECYFMMGLPGETERDMDETIEFALELNPTYAKCAMTTTLPDTPLEHFAPIKNYRDCTFAPHSKLLRRKYWEFYRRFYLRPSYALNLMDRLL